MNETLGSRPPQTDEELAESLKDVGRTSERARAGVAHAGRSDLEATLFPSTHEQIEAEQRVIQRERRRQLGHAATIPAGIRMLPPRRPGTSRMGRTYR